MPKGSPHKPAPLQQVAVVGPITSSLESRQLDFAAFVQPLYAGALRHVQRHRVSKDDAMDIVQQVISELWQRWASIPLKSRHKGYFIKAVHHRMADVLDAKGRRVRYSLDDRDDAATVEYALQVMPSQLGTGHDMDEVYVAMRELPERESEAFDLVRLHGLTFEEAAECMGSKAGTVKKQVYEALKKIRAICERQDGRPLTPETARARALPIYRPEVSDAR